MKRQKQLLATLIGGGTLALASTVALAQSEPEGVSPQEIAPAATPVQCPRPKPPGSPTPAPSPAPAADVTVSIKTLRFSPDRITIRVGQTVKWTNDSPAAHTVTDDPCEATNQSNSALPQGAEPFDSGTISPRSSFTKTFTVPGEYKYFCKFHERAGMVGTITVAP